MCFLSALWLAGSVAVLHVQPTRHPDAFTLWQRGAFRGANVMLDRCTVDDLRVLRSWGANLAELPVSNIYAPAAPYALQPENLARLDRAVEAAGRAGLYAVLTCREGPGRPDFERSHEIWRDAEAQAAYARMWREVASHFRDRAAVVGYDLMCEPHPDQDADTPLGDWNSLAKRITAAIREVDKRTPILVNSVGWAYPERFDVLRPTGDPRTVYVVHFYDPHYYTHQKPGDNVVYPGFRVPGETGPAWDKAAIEAHLAPVRAFQIKYHVPIFAGEFGCARYARGAEPWLRDQMDLYEKYGWTWAYWAFREWDVMNIERTADPADDANHTDTPLLTLFKGFYARDRAFFSER
jgi:aryl-phospho-beta-D-glucosidase BglC (GH1 family)